ncbi:MAG: [acyl-carrier-protein] S-malonyltransferase [Candidatus Riflebacteria bacterium HGW-Riflebacteria-1]|jgi:[acyl-carrier-protein] S-malonyltransferase|nr:MAG: [acyl-carrier-protein] S-malonyltransferase [Candidatus Riflebacteria bacterium HGW-Riflebacteria-1]
MRALIFPGQGSQKVGMAKAMADKYIWAAEMAEKAEALLERPIFQICCNGPEEELKKTVNTQPAIFMASAMMTEWLRLNGYEYAMTAGHSLGEYNALLAAGVASFEDLIRLVDIRARAMERACPAGTGAMSAILMLDRVEVERVCKEASSEGVCVVANFNCPGQVVISGVAAAVKKAGELAVQAGARKVTPLEVSGPFHSPLMQGARDELAHALENIVFADARVPVYCNVDAMPTTSAAELKNKLLQQITGSVRYEDAVLNMVKHGVGEFVEVGPGKVLAGLNKKIAATVPTQFASDPDTLTALLQANQTAELRA